MMEKNKKWKTESLQKIEDNFANISTNKTKYRPISYYEYIAATKSEISRMPEQAFDKLCKYLPEIGEQNTNNLKIIENIKIDPDADFKTLQEFIELNYHTIKGKYPYTGKFKRLTKTLFAEKTKHIKDSKWEKTKQGGDLALRHYMRMMSMTPTRKRYG